MRVVLKSNPKFFGNSADRKEKFFDFKDQRIFKRSLDKHELTILCNPENIWEDNFPYLNNAYETFIKEILDIIPFQKLINSVEISDGLNNIESQDFVYLLSTKNLVCVSKLRQLDMFGHLIGLLMTDYTRRKKNIYLTLRNLSGFDLYDDEEHSQKIMSDYSSKSLLNDVINKNITNHITGLGEELEKLQNNEFKKEFHVATNLVNNLII